MGNEASSKSPAASRGHALWLGAYVMLLLALAATLAVNASAAQAITFLEGTPGNSVAELNVEGETTEGGTIAVPGLELEIHCEEAVGTGRAVAATQAASAEVDFFGCEVVENPFCTPEIATASGEGEISMVGGNDVAELESEEFTNIIMEGPFCTLPEESPLSGILSMTVSDPFEFAAVHVTHLDDVELFYGEEPMVLVGDNGPDVDGVSAIDGVTNYASHLP